MKAKDLPPVDETVRVPRAVRAASERADRLVAEANKSQPADEPAENTNPEPNTPEPNTPEPPAPEPTDREIVAEPPKPEQVTPPGNPEPDWQHKYRSLEGRYNGAMARISDLENLIASLQVPEPAAPAPASAERPRLITPEEENEYGDEFLSVVGKKAREELLAEIAPLKQTIEHLSSTVQRQSTVTAQSARDRMLEALDQRVPNWRDVNRDSSFLEWLQLPDVFSGVTRQSLLTQAYESNQTSRVLAFFEGFLASEAAPAPLKQGAVEPAPTNEVAKIPLETLAAPGRAKSAAPADPGGPAEKPIFTRAQIAKFYSDSAAGRYRGREQERAKLEKQIFEAQRDGRIR